MTLLITVFAAIICTVVWYSRAPKDEMKTGTLSLIFWGASLMWFADFIAEYAENKAACFTPTPADMLNDSFLGLAVVALGLIIWLVILLIKDPKGVIKEMLFRKNELNTLAFLPPFCSKLFTEKQRKSRKNHHKRKKNVSYFS